jgi:lauroyl/myristoyl acyltransferase
VITTDLHAWEGTKDQVGVLIIFWRLYLYKNGMLAKNYTRQLNLFCRHYEALDIRNNDKLSMQYNIVSASLLNFLPEIEVGRHESIYRSILLHQRLSVFEQDHPAILENVSMENLAPGTLTAIKQRPAIICTFHLGSYRLINLLLVKYNLPFSLVIAKSVIKAQGDTYTALYDKISEGNNAGDFDLIDAEEPNAAIQMLRSLKKGKSLVVYVDGNTGSGSLSRQKENSCCLPFLHQQIAARKGIGFLAHAANTPVLPVICYRKSVKDIVLRFHEIIDPEPDMERNTFAQTLMKKLYDFASPLIRTYPEQWEAWLYLHKVANIINPVKRKQEPEQLHQADNLIFNDRLFGLFKTSSAHYLFNKTSYMSYPIDKNLYALLQNAPIKKNNIDVNLLSELYKNRALITPNT